MKYRRLPSVPSPYCMAAFGHMFKQERQREHLSSSHTGLRWYTLMTCSGQMSSQILHSMHASVRVKGSVTRISSYAAYSLRQSPCPLCLLRSPEPPEDTEAAMASASPLALSRMGAASSFDGTSKAMTALLGILTSYMASTLRRDPRSSASWSQAPPEEPAQVATAKTLPGLRTVTLEANSRTMDGSPPQ